MSKRANQRIHKSINQVLGISVIISPLYALLVSGILAFTLIFIISASSQFETKPINQIQFRLDGEIVASDTLPMDLQRKMHVHVGGLISFYQIRKSIELIYTTGLFSQVTVIETPQPDGVLLTFDLTTKILIGKIDFKGNTPK